MKTFAAVILVFSLKLSSPFTNIPPANSKILERKQYDILVNMERIMEKRQENGIEREIRLNIVIEEMKHNQTQIREDCEEIKNVIQSKLDKFEEEILNLKSKVKTLVEDGVEKENNLTTLSGEGKETENNITALIEEGKETKHNLTALIEEGKERENNLVTLIDKGKEREKNLTTLIEEDKETKNNLTALIEEGKETKNNLTALIEEGKERENNLTALIEEGKETENNLTTLIEEDKGTKNNLKALIEEGKERENSLKTAIEESKRNQTQIREDCEEIQNQIQSKLDKFKEENQSLKNEVNKLKSPISQGFSYVNGRWTIGSGSEFTFSGAVRWCSDRNSEMFIPRTEEDFAFLETYVLSTAHKRIWFPITDAEEEGRFLWTNGTALSQQDEKRIIWRQSEVYCFNSESKDCAIMYRSTAGTHISICDHKYPGVLCSLK